MELYITEKLLKKMLESNDFSSYALIVGYKGQEWMYTSPDVDADTYFDAASLGKVYPTSTLALQAVSKGLLSLEDTLDKFFDNVPEDKKGIRIRHLLTHTSGILRGHYPENVAERGRESVIDFIFGRPVAFQPGEHYCYSCDAILTLGFILEKVFEMPLDQAFQKLLLEPLGLKRSKYNISINEENAATCYHHLFTPKEPWDDDNVCQLRGIPAGNGGNFCTPGDLRTFVKALLNKDERLYSKDLFEVAERNYTAGLTPWPRGFVYGNHGFGYEYIDSKSPYANSLFPDGSVGKEGFTGQSFFFNREKQLYVILLTNATRHLMLNFGKIEYGKVIDMRVKVHNAIKEDLGL